ncbi:MAG: ABC transporter substrate-binding protein [Phycisphaerae bacterium]|nr:ABC transporter substrate-binding protein [Phycisphaerae bacterium]
MPASRIELTLGHSPDADDVFMWWPLTGMVDPADWTRVTGRPELDTDRFAFRPVVADIQEFNLRAAREGDLDVTALSVFGYAHVADRYALTACGGSFGEGYGPKVVGRRGAGWVEGTGSDPAERLRDRTIAVPGTRTTAYLVLTLMMRGRAFRAVEMPFGQIADAVREGRVEAGVLIHEGQVTEDELGVAVVADLGAWWAETTRLPLPLGGNAIRRDLDARHGAGTIATVAGLLRRSIDHALRERDRSTRYAMAFSPTFRALAAQAGLSAERLRARADRYIDMYVSGLTIDCGARGEAAVRELLSLARRVGMLPAGARVDVIPSGVPAAG